LVLQTLYRNIVHGFFQEFLTCCDILRQNPPCKRHLCKMLAESTQVERNPMFGILGGQDFSRWPAVDIVIVLLRGFKIRQQIVDYSMIDLNSKDGLNFWDIF
jgi:hypothetical protein